MKYAAALVMILLLWGTAMSEMPGTLIRAERLTASEQQKLSDAQVKVDSANREMATVKAEIAEDHKMHNEQWMEWKRWFEFDGEFILERYHSYMSMIVPVGGKK